MVKNLAELWRSALALRLRLSLESAGLTTLRVPVIGWRRVTHRRVFRYTISDGVLNHRVHSINTFPSYRLPLLCVNSQCSDVRFIVILVLMY